jgi:DNA repair protein RadA/Sms
VGLTGELRFVAHPDRRVAEGLKFGLGPVIGPPAAEPIEGLSPSPTLAAALRSARRSRAVAARAA